MLSRLTGRPGVGHPVTVKRNLTYAIIVSAALSSAACRQADGPLPPSTGTVPNELGDISRDLQNLASGSPEGPKDLADDISHYAEGTNGGQAAAAELSQRLGQALTGKTFKLAEALPLAHSCWVAVAGRQLSEKQVENLQNEMTSQLMSLGANEQQAQSVAAQAGVVQQAVTARHRRWYELL
jgi:hypothetical protein